MPQVLVGGVVTDPNAAPLVDQCRHRRASTEPAGDGSVSRFMPVSQRLRVGERLAWLTVLLAAVAAAAGLAVPELYRDNEAMTAQAQSTDLATLLVAVPALAIGLWRARAGSIAGRLVGLGALGYLVYAYVIFAFQVVINPATPVYIAVLGLATWSLLLLLPSLRVATEHGAASRLPRWPTAAFFGLIVLAFGGLWLSEIAGAISSGTLPASVSDLELPTAAVYALDLAFLLPAAMVGAVLLSRRSPLGPPLAVVLLVFTVAMALSILGLFVFQALRGMSIDPSLLIGFGVLTAIAAVLAAFGLRSPESVRHPAIPDSAVGVTR